MWEVMLLPFQNRFQGMNEISECSLVVQALVLGTRSGMFDSSHSDFGFEAKTHEALGLREIRW